MLWEGDAVQSILKFAFTEKKSFYIAIKIAELPLKVPKTQRPRNQSAKTESHAKTRTLCKALFAPSLSSGQKYATRSKKLPFA